MKEKRLSVITILVAALALAGMLFIAAAPATASEMTNAQGIVDKARITFNDFMNDQHYTWFHEHLKDAKGLLIFPEVLKAGFILGGSGGNGVLVLRNEKTCDWSEPAFYTVGSVTFGLQAGGEAAEVIMMVMSQKAVDSLLASSFKLGGDTSIALGPVGEGAKANINADFISFAKAKGIYAGINLEGSVVKVRDGLNSAYYGREVRPTDILVKKDVASKGSDEFLGTLKKMSISTGQCTS
ncbi:MAG: lipid-binding SYLF domain-containing protein [Acidobacteriota bacterium]